MSFAQTLERLKDAAHNRQPGRRPDVCVVRPKDLDELLYHFERLDDAAREQYHAEQEAWLSGLPKVTVEKLCRGPDYPTPYRAHIIVTGSDHHGEADSPEQALVYAAEHWLQFMGASAQNGRDSAADTTDSDRQLPLAETRKPA